MPNYNMSEREAAAVMHLGTKVERATANMTTGLALFDIEGGNCLITLLVGEVTTILEDHAVNYKLSVDVDTGTDTDLCANLACQKDEAGTLYSIEGAPGTAMQVGSSGSVPGPTYPSVVAPGAIDITVSAATTGSVKWTLWYIPLEVGAYINAT